MTRRGLGKFVDVVLGREHVAKETEALLAARELECSTTEFTVRAVAMRKSVLARMLDITNDQMEATHERD